MGYYLHELPGRLRIIIPSLKRNGEGAAELQALLKMITGILSVSVSTVTGSVVVHFDQRFVTSRTILTVLAQEGYIDLASAISSHQYVERAVSSFGKTASKALLGLALDRAFQGTPFALLTAFI